MASFSRLSCKLILLSVLIVSGAKADDSIRSITEAFVLGVLSADDSGGGSQHQASSLADDGLRDLAEARARALADNARLQSDTVLEVALPDSIAGLIDTSLLEYVEEYSELEGHLTATFLEYNDFSRVYQIALRPTDDTDPIFLHFDRPPPALPLGHLVRVRGVLLPRVDDEAGGSARHMVLRSDDDALEVVSAPEVISAPPPVGFQRTAAFLVRFSDDPSPLAHSDYDKEWRQLRKLVRRHSMGRAWLPRVGVQQVGLEIPRTCDGNAIHQNITSVLDEFGENAEEYDRVFAILPTLECSWRTHARFPGSPTVVLVGGEPETKQLLRALLHSFGMPGQQASSCDFDAVHSECQMLADPEPEHLRGVGAISIDPFHKESIGWASDDHSNEILLVEGRGSYRIFAGDYAATRNRRLALKLERPAPLWELDTTYYIEYRVRRAGHERLPPEVVVYIVSGSRITDVLNLTFPSRRRAELRDAISVSDGRFVDHAAGIEIEVVNAYPWAVDLDISFDPTSCVPAAPAIETAPRETPYLSTDSTMRFSVAITSRHSEQCGPTGLNLSLQVPNGWHVQHSPETPILHPGGTVQAEVSVTIPPGEEPGFRDLEWIVKGDALIEAHRSTMLFVLPRSGKTDESDKIPEPTRTINVSSSGELSSALSNARPGDHIVLANGRYNGFTISRSGQNGKPIVVRAQNTLGAKISGARIKLDGDYVWVIGMDISDSVGVLINGTGDRISSSRLRVWGSAVHIEGSARSAVVDHNEIDSQAEPTSRGWNGVRIDVTSPNLDHHIYRNYLHGAPKWSGDGDDNSGMQIGFGGSWDVDGGVLVEYNLFEDWHGDSETISVKTSGHTIRFNTGINVEQFVNRVGHDTTWAANWMENSGDIRIHGYDHTLLGNHGEIRLYAGSHTPSEWKSGEKGYIAATNIVAAGNTGRLIVGAAFSSGYNSRPANGNRVEAHTGSVSKRKEVNTTISSATSRTIPTAFKLTPEDVGPFAPTAPTL